MIVVKGIIGDTNRIDIPSRSRKAKSFFSKSDSCGLAGDMTACSRNNSFKARKRQLRDVDRADLEF